jgi:predicted ferric reductase
VSLIAADARVAVFACGPQPMLDSAQRACFDRQPRVHFHKETFLL